MTDTKQKLRQLEEEKNIKIILAKDIGSKAWKLDSPESDTDIGILYTQEPKTYVKLKGYKQNIDTELGQDIDIQGWNIDRYMKLLKQSNPAVVEHLLSDTTYLRESVETTYDMETYTMSEFKPLALMQHYHSLAENQYKSYLKNGSRKTVKKTLYTLKALTHKRHVENTHTAPDPNFPRFVNNSMDAGPINSYKPQLNKLIEAKKRGDGSKPYHNRHIDKLIQKELDRTYTGQEKRMHSQRSIDPEILDQFTDTILENQYESEGLWGKII